MGYDLGKAYINIVPSTSGMGKSIEKELAGVGSRAGSSKGSGLGGKLWGGLKIGAGVAGAAIGGVLAGSISKGFTRLKDIENAEAKLRGLGHSAEDISSIMENALNAVKGTSFGMGDAATLAGTLVASGIKPGEELEKTLKLTADSATIAGRELGDMGLIWGSVAAKGELQGDDAMQLLASGVPIWQMVGDVMGKTAGEAQELGSKGKVSFDVFRQAMEQGVGGAALESGKTTEGAFKNMGAAMGRFGAAILKDVYPLIGPLLGKVTDFFDYLTKAAEPVLGAITEKFQEFGKGIKGVWDVLVGGDFTGAENLFGFEEDSAFVTFLFGVRDVAKNLYDTVLKPIGAWVSDNWQLIASVLGGIVGVFAGGALVSAVAAVGAAIGSIFSVAGVVTAAIGAVVGGLGYFFTQTETGKNLVATAWAGIQTAVSAVVTWFQASVWPVLVQGWDYLKWAVSTTWPVIQGVFQSIGSLIQQVWTGVIQPALAQFGGYLLNTVWPIVQRLWSEVIQPAFTAIGAAAQWLWFNMVGPALQALGGFIQNTLAPVITWLWQTIISPAFSFIGSLIAATWNNVIFPALGALGAFITGTLAPTFVSLWETSKAVWQGIQSAVRAVVSWFQTWVWPVLSMVIELAKVGFTALKDVLATVWSTIQNTVISPVVQWFQNTAWPLISTVIESIKSGFNTMRDVLATAWSYVKDTVIAPVANWFRDTIGPLFTTVTDSTGKSFTSMKDVISKAWEGIRDAAKAPIRFVVETIINGALIGNFNKLAEKLGTPTLPTVSLPSGFARGGVLPGTSRMRDGDDQLVPMRRGEGVLVSEGLRTREDRAAFLAANAAGRRGVGFASLMAGGFAGGGIWDGVKSTAGDAWNGAKDVGRNVKDFAGDALDKVLDGADFVAEALADPSSIFKRLFEEVAGNIPGAGLMVDAAKGVGKKLVDGLISKATGAIGASFDVSGALGSVKQGLAGAAGFSRAAAAASRLGLRMTSGTRRGARTAKSGSVSLHALGRARDYAGTAAQMSAFFDAMDVAPYPTELLYSPKGSRNIHRGGGRYANSGATKSNHYNHVHVGFSEGGWTGPGSKYQPAGVVHADEFVLSKSARRSIESARPGFLDRLNAMGAAGLAGYARGGLVKGYASGGKVSSSSGKVGKVNVADILAGLLGTPKQVRAAADKLASQVTSAFKAQGSASKKSTVNSLSDQLDSLKKKASALTKVSRETVRVTSKINGKTRTSKVATADAKAASSELKGVQAQIAKTQDALKKARRGDTSGAAEAKSAAYEAGVLAGRTLKLTAYANTREKLAARIKKATEALDEAVKIRDDYSSSMQEKLAGSFGISSDTVGMSIKGITENFKASAYNIGKFGHKILQLRKRGLPDGLVDQVAQLGAVDGGKVADSLLKGSKADVSRLNTWFNATQTNASKVGFSLASQFYGAGVDSARGLVDGLNSQLKRVNGAAKKVADSLVKTVKKALKIHSPSRVFRELGGFTGAGMVLGIEDSSEGVQSAMRAMVEPPRTSSDFYSSNPVSAWGDGSGLSLTDEAINRLADALASRPNVLTMGSRDASKLALAGAAGSRAMGGRW